MKIREPEVLGRSLLLLIVLFAMALMIAACSPYYYQSKGPKVTHVLALTEEVAGLRERVKFLEAENERLKLL